MVKTNEDLAAEEAADNTYVEDVDVRSNVVRTIHSAWARNKQAKREIDDELLKCLRQVEGQYDPEERQLIAQQGGGNTIYMMLPATKVGAAVSWFQDVLLPTGELPVGVEPTEISELPPQAYVEMMRALAQRLRGQAQGPTPSQVDELQKDMLTRMNQTAEKRADKMTTHIHDTLEQGNFRGAMEEFLNDFATYPTAFLKGPVKRRESKIEWGPNFQPKATEILTTTFERVSPFDMYPSPDADNLDEGDLIERMRMTRAQIYDLKQRPGYDAAAIDRVLAGESLGNLSCWLFTDTERAELSDKGGQWIAENELVDALQFWGFIDGRHLTEWGLERDLEPLKPYQVEAVVIGDECIRCRLLDDPLETRPYQAASMYSRPGELWGESMLKRIRNTCSMLNSIARSLADNLAIASGPQAVVNVDALADGEDVTNIFPWKIWQASYDMNAGGSRPPVEFFQPDANVGELLTVYENFAAKADDESGVPRYAYGNEEASGAAQTFGGLSLLFDAASKGIRRAISNVDSYVMRPIAEKLWLDYMRYGDDMDAKGDGRIVAKGTAAILIEDQAQQRRAAFLQQTANPIDMQIIGLQGRAEVLRELTKSLGMPASEIVPSSDEIAQKQAAQAQQVPPEQRVEMAKLELEQAKLQLEKAKAVQNAENEDEKLAIEATKARSDLIDSQSEARSERAQARNEYREQTQEHEQAAKQYKLDVAKYLSEEDQREFDKRMAILDELQQRGDDSMNTNETSGSSTSQSTGNDS